MYSVNNIQVGCQGAFAGKTDRRRLRSING
jgi:hypothetical protein